MSTTAIGDAQNTVVRPVLRNMGQKFTPTDWKEAKDFLEDVHIAEKRKRQ